MKKIFIPLFIVTFILIGLVFTVFTKFGNSLIASNLQEVLSNELQKDVKVERFNLSFNDINTTISFDDSKFVLDSIFDVFEQNVSANYLVDIKELGNLESLIDKKLNGSFFTLGKAVGTIEDVKVSGRAKVAKGDIKYFYAKESNILQADVKSIHLESLLYLLNEPLYIMGRLNTAINLRDFQGDIKTKIYNGYLNKKVLKLPEAISIKGDILTKLSKKEAISKADIYTSVANIHSKALKVDLKTTFIDGDYRLELYDFAKLEPFAKQRLRGKATVLGDITKDRDLVVNGNSKLLDGELDFKLKNDDLRVNIDDNIFSGLAGMQITDGIIQISEGANTTQFKGGSVITPLAISEDSVVSNQLSLGDGSDIRVVAAGVSETGYTNTNGLIISQVDRIYIQSGLIYKIDFN